MRRLRMFHHDREQAAAPAQAALAAAEAARDTAQQRLEQEKAKRPGAQQATARLGRIEQENHLAHLFRQAFNGR